MNKKKVGIIAGVIIILVLIILIPKLNKVKASDTVSETEAVNEIAVSTIKPVKGNLEHTVFTIGEVSPSATYSVLVKASGNVEATYFEVGDTVHKDAVLFELETDSFNVSKQTTLSQLQNAMKQSELGLNQAQDNYDKQKALYDQGAISEITFKTVESALENAKIVYQNASASYRNTASQLDDQYDTYVQKSPIDGVIVSKNISEGQFVSQQVAYTIIPESDYVLNGSIASKYINEVARGQKAHIYVNTLDKYYEGEITTVSNVASSGSYPIELSLEGDEALRAGLYAEIEIVLSERSDVMLLPKELVKEDENGYFVYVVTSDDISERRHVEVGQEDETYYEIILGLDYTDDVIELGLDYVDEGIKVVRSE